MSLVPQTDSPSTRPLTNVPVPWVYVLIYLVGVVLEFLFPIGSLKTSSWPIGRIGAIVFALGVGLAAWGWLLFQRAGTTRVPGEASTTLMVRGPYRFTRNPMYVGLAWAYLGEAGLLRQLWPVILLPVVLAYVNWGVIPVEEAKLREVFGGEYDRYRARVRRWL
jgi:protein-S-isoprenylcysteine O-methyltransferase Ste14